MICVDASVAAKWIFRETWSEQARNLYDDVLRSGDWIVAPPLMPIEVSNALRKRMRPPDPVSLANATVLLEEFLALRFLTLDAEDLLPRALAIADAFKLSAVYDAHYIALAEMLGCEFWTDDQQLLLQVERDLPSVRWIGDYQST